MSEKSISLFFHFMIFSKLSPKKHWNPVLVGIMFIDLEEISKQWNLKSSQHHIIKFYLYFNTIQHLSISGGDGSLYRRVSTQRMWSNYIVAMWVKIVRMWICVHQATHPTNTRMYWMLRWSLPTVLQMSPTLDGFNPRCLQVSSTLDVSNPRCPGGTSSMMVFVLDDLRILYCCCWCCCCYWNKCLFVYTMLFSVAYGFPH